jgi:hypothetical protein
VGVANAAHIPSLSQLALNQPRLSIQNRSQAGLCVPFSARLGDPACHLPQPVSAQDSGDKSQGSTSRYSPKQPIPRAIFAIVTVNGSRAAVPHRLRPSVTENNADLLEGAFLHPEVMIAANPHHPLPSLPRLDQRGPERDMSQVDCALPTPTKVQYIADEHPLIGLPFTHERNQIGLTLFGQGA